MILGDRLPLRGLITHLTGGSLLGAASFYLHRFDTKIASLDVEI